MSAVTDLRPPGLKTMAPYPRSWAPPEGTLTPMGDAIAAATRALRDLEHHGRFDVDTAARVAVNAAAGHLERSLLARIAKVEDRRRALAGRLHRLYAAIKGL